MECRVDCKSGFIKIGDVNDLKTLPFYIEKGKKLNKNTKIKRASKGIYVIKQNQ